MTATNNIVYLANRQNGLHLYYPEFTELDQIQKGKEEKRPYNNIEGH